MRRLAGEAGKARAAEKDAYEPGAESDAEELERRSWEGRERVGGGKKE